MRKKATINVKNLPNDECFQVAALPALFPATHNPNQVTNYGRFVGDVNWDEVKFPVALPQIRLFVRNNPHIRIYVHVFVEKGMAVIPVYILKLGKREKQVDLLLMKGGDKLHHVWNVWIKSMSALVCHRTKHCHTTYVYPLHSPLFISRLFH